MLKIVKKIPQNHSAQKKISRNNKFEAVFGHFPL